MPRTPLHPSMLLILLALLAFSGVGLVIAQSTNPPEDPVAHGAWLYGGYCVNCHGSYSKSVAGQDVDPGELRDAISGATRGCQVKWSILNGGSLTAKEIDALVSFITAWQAAGGPPDLPPLPLFPTFTPAPSATLDGQEPTPEPSQTPLVETNPRINMITSANPVALGARLYTRRCFRCHLSYGYGRMGIGMEEEKIKRAINEGKAGTSMPAFSWREGGNLRVKDVNAIIAYIIAWEALDSDPALPEELFIPPTPDPQSLQMVPLKQVPPVDGRVELGMVLFGEHCQDCHGPGGAGGSAPSLHQDWHSVRADLTIRSTILEGVPGTAMQPMSGLFNDEQIDSLVALVLEWSPERVEEEEMVMQKQNTGWLPALGALLILLPMAWIFINPLLER